MSDKKNYEQQQQSCHERNYPTQPMSAPSTNMTTANVVPPQYADPNAYHQHDDGDKNQYDYGKNSSSSVLDEKTLYSHPQQSSSAFRQPPRYNSKQFEPMFHEKIDESIINNPVNDSSPTLYDIEGQSYDNPKFVVKQPSIKHSKERSTFARRNRCLKCLCCACCLPPWLAYGLWTIIVAIFIIIIIFICLLATFKIPDINLAGVNTNNLPEGKKLLQFTSTDVIINAGLVINVKNPNVLGLKISDIKAKAYWPMENGKKFQIGKGYLKHQDIPKNSDINFIYPFEIDYDLFDKEASSLLNELSEKCGLTGGSPSNIDITYDLQLAAQVLFVKIHPTISSAASFECPLQNSPLASTTSDTDNNISSDEDEISNILSNFAEKIPAVDGLDRSSSKINGSQYNDSQKNDITTLTTILKSLNATTAFTPANN